MAHKWNKGDQATLVNLVHTLPEAIEQYPIGTPIIITAVAEKSNKGGVWWKKEGETREWLADFNDIKPR